MKITNIESIPYAIPVKNFTDAYTDFTHSNAVLIKMHTDEGVTGIGEACAWEPEFYGETVESIHTTILNYIAPNIIGEEKEWSLSEAEMKYRKFAKRQAVAAREIAVGTKLDLKDIVFKRTNEKGLSTQDLAEYAGREFARSKNNDDPLTPEDFVGS